MPSLLPKGVVVAASRQTGAFVVLLGSGVMLTGLISAPLFVQHFRQWQAQSFEQTPGRVVKTTKLQDARGIVVDRLDLRYEYFVGGQRYENTTFRFDPFPETPEWERSVAKRYPVGSEVTVFYRPGVPSVALLEPGVDWGKLNAELLLWLCLPGFAICLVAIILDEVIYPPVYLQPITVDGTVSVHAQSKWIALAMSGIGLSVIAVGGGIMVWFTWASASWLAIPIWLAVFVLPVHFHRAFRESWEQGTYDLTIDFEKGTLTLPGAMLTPRTTLKLADLKQIIVRPANLRAGRKCTQCVVVARFEYLLLWIGGHGDENAFCKWLAGQLAIPVTVDDPNRQQAE